MKIITISRQFGSGGRELGKRLADLLGFDYYDREIITAIAQTQGLNEDYMEKALDEHPWQTVPITFRRSFAAPTIMNQPQTTLLLAQRRVIEAIAKAGKDCVIVGRNADVILIDHRPFRVFVCAETQARIQRCLDRAAPGETASQKEIEQNMRRIDKNRARTRELLCHGGWGDPVAHELTVNTTGWDLKALTPAVAEFALRWFGGQDANSAV